MQEIKVKKFTKRSLFLTEYFSRYTFLKCEFIVLLPLMHLGLCEVNVRQDTDLSKLVVRFM